MNIPESWLRAFCNPALSGEALAEKLRGRAAEGGPAAAYTAAIERYARMDPLVEVEGPPDAIERVIEALGMDRAGFTADRLSAFITRFERRTGTPAIVNGADRAGRDQGTPDD